MPRWLALWVVVLPLGGTVWAHHSISGAYDTRQETSLEATVTRFQFVAPHPFIIVSVLRGGAPELWELEMDNRGELSSIGITEATFRAGDRIVVRGSLARTEPRRLYIRRLDRPADGFGYEQVGSRPRLRPSTR
jgi:hypothetical protein